MPINVPKINLSDVSGDGDNARQNYLRQVDRGASGGANQAHSRKSKSRSRAQWGPPKKAPEEDYLEPGFDPSASIASSFYLPSEPQSARSGRSSRQSARAFENKSDR